jgi:hypothetical protein
LTVARRPKVESYRFKDGVLVSPPPETLRARRQANGHANGQAAPAAVATADNGAAPTPAESPANGRGADGRFTPGNKAAAGNPFHRAVAARRKALLEAIGPEDVAAVGRKLRDMALAGDVAACKVLLSYAVGKPAEAADPDRLDLHEIALLMETPDLKKLLADALERVPADMAARLAADLLLANPQRIMGLLDGGAPTGANQ